MSSSLAHLPRTHNTHCAQTPISETAMCPVRALCIDRYYVGINAYQTGDFKKAVDFFGRATKAACGSITEEDFGAFLLQESKKGLKLAQAALTAEQAA
eukprot:scaffold187978_cov33-Tisochrysis_lutea.AAC.1